MGSAKSIIEKNTNSVDELPPIGDYYLSSPNGEFLTKLSEKISAGRNQRSFGYWVCKRLFDATTAILAIIFLSPLFVLIAVAIRLTSAGPVIFTQQRVGERLRLFTIFKFRTMYANVSERPAAIFDPIEKRIRRPTFNEDPRVTPVGKILKRFSLDELPQLFNILRGDMSLVGPRPLPVNESLNIPDEALVRYSVPAGLTGLAQIANRSAILTPDRFTPDIHYVQKISAVRDLKIIIATAWLLSRNKW